MVTYKSINDLGNTSLTIGNDSFIPVLFDNQMLNDGTYSKESMTIGDKEISLDTSSSLNVGLLRSYFFSKIYKDGLGNTLNYNDGTYTAGGVNNLNVYHQVLFTFFQSNNFKTYYGNKSTIGHKSNLDQTTIERIKNVWIPKMLQTIYSLNPKLFDNLLDITNCYVTGIPEYADLITANRPRGERNVYKFNTHLAISFKIQYYEKSNEYVISQSNKQNNAVILNYDWSIFKNPTEIIYVKIPDSTSGRTEDNADLLPDLTNEVYENMTGLIKLPDTCVDLWDRTCNLRSHVTHWDENGQIVNNNEKYVKYVDPNCYAHSQYVWKVEDKVNWPRNYDISTIQARQCLWVSGAWFAEDGIYSTDPGLGYNAVWSPYTILPNGQGHNTDNGFTLGTDVTTYWSNFRNGDWRTGFTGVSAETQSAICFTNLVNFTKNNAMQKQIYAYTEGDDFQETLVEGVTPSINLSIKGQSVGRFNLETNNILTRW